MVMPVERDFPRDHPAAVDYDGTPAHEPYFGPGFDYPPDHPARGGQGQPVPVVPGTTRPRDGFEHLAGVPGATLAERERNLPAELERRAAEKKKAEKP